MKIEFPKLLEVSHSRIKTWRRCQMAHHYKYYQKLDRKKKATPLWIGTAIHSCLEEFCEGRDWRKPLTEFKKEYDKLFAEEKLELGDLPTELESIVEGYLKRWESDGLTYPQRRWGIRSEIPLRVEVLPNVIFRGFVDKYPQDSEGRNWLMDHKSCKRIPDEDSRFTDLQFVAYCWLLPLAGYPKPDGIIWDYIRKKSPVVPEVLVKGGLSKSSKMDTTYDVYMATVDAVLGEEARSEYEEFASTFKGREDRFYRRVRLPHPSEQLVESVVRDFLSSCLEIQEFGPQAVVRNMTRDCSKMCSYYNLCQIEVRGLDSDFIRKSEYIIKGEENAEEDGNEEEDGDSEA